MRFRDLMGYYPTFYFRSEKENAFCFAGFPFVLIFWFSSSVESDGSSAYVKLLSFAIHGVTILYIYFITHGLTRIYIR